MSSFFSHYEVHYCHILLLIWWVLFLSHELAARLQAEEDERAMRAMNEQQQRQQQQQPQGQRSAAAAPGASRGRPRERAERDREPRDKSKDNVSLGGPCRSVCLCTSLVLLCKYLLICGASLFCFMQV